MSELVSIIIPCFNAESVIADAINSALGQTYSNCEVIIIDDGSTDGSLEVIKQFGSRIQFQSWGNHGGCLARNEGLRLAKGKFIQFLDADDILSPDKLEIQLPLSSQYTDAVVYTDHFVVDSHVDSKPVLRSMEVTSTDPVLFILNHKALTTIGPLHRREWLEQVGGFKPGLRASQEFDLHLRLAGNGCQFVHLPKPLFTVRRQANSVSSNTGKTLATLIEFFPDFVETLESRNALTSERRRACAGYAASVGRQCIRQQQVDVGEQLLEFAFQLDRTGAEEIAFGRTTRILRRLVGSRLLETITSRLRPRIV